LEKQGIRLSNDWKKSLNNFQRLEKHRQIASNDWKINVHLYRARAGMSRTEAFPIRRPMTGYPG